MWDATNESYEVWKNGKREALCAWDVNTLELWWDWMVKTYFPDGIINP